MLIRKKENNNRTAAPGPAQKHTCGHTQTHGQSGDYPFPFQLDMITVGNGILASLVSSSCC